MTTEKLNDKYAAILNNVVNFPPARSDQGVTPNPFIRSSLFGLVKKGEAKFVDAKLIATQGDHTLLYSGKELNQANLDVWLCLQKIWIENDCKPVECDSKEILKTIGLSYAKGDKLWLKDKIEDLVKATLLFEFDNGRTGFTGRLIKELEWTGDYHTFKFDLDNKLKNMFGCNDFTYLDFKKRREIRSDLGTWLFSYYRSHKELFPIHISKLYLYSGSSSELKEFKRSLKNAHEELLKVGYIQAYEINKQGIVFVTRNLQKELTINP